MTDALPYFRWYPKHYRANRKVQRMSWKARGIYRELLDEEWLEGPLPNDISVLADLAGCPVREMEKAWPEIAPCFESVDGRLVNPKLEGMRTEQDELRVKRIIAGRLGGQAKQVLASAKQTPGDARQVPYRKRNRKEEQPAHTSDEVSALPAANYTNPTKVYSSPEYQEKARPA